MLSVATNVEGVWFAFMTNSLGMLWSNTFNEISWRMRFDFVSQAVSHNWSWGSSVPAGEFHSLIERSYPRSIYFKVNIFAKIFRIGLHWTNQNFLDNIWFIPAPDVFRVTIIARSFKSSPSFEQPPCLLSSFHSSFPSIFWLKVG